MIRAYSKKIKDFTNAKQVVSNVSLFMSVSDAHLHMYLISQLIYAKNVMDTAKLAMQTIFLFVFHVLMAFTTI